MCFFLKSGTRVPISTFKAYLFFSFSRQIALVRTPIEFLAGGSQYLSMAKCDALSTGGKKEPLVFRFNLQHARSLVHESTHRAEFLPLPFSLILCIHSTVVERVPALLN